MKTVRSLFVKDWMVLNRQLLFMLIYIVIFIGLFAASDSGFLTSVFSALVVLLAINCFAYDEQAHFDKLLAATPAAAWQIVLSRYLTSLSLGLLGTGFITGLQAVIYAVRNEPERIAGALVVSTASLGVGIFCAAVMFPLFYKFGVNKGRIVMILACAVPAAISGGISTLLRNPDHLPVQPAPAILSALPWLLVLLVAAALAVSFVCAVHIVRNKQYCAFYPDGYTGAQAKSCAPVLYSTRLLDYNEARKPRRFTCTIPPTTNTAQDKEAFPMLLYKRTPPDQLALYDTIPMLVDIRSIFTVTPVNCGLGGLLLQETPVPPRIKDLGVYERLAELPRRFDLTNWAFFLALSLIHI